MNPPLVTVLMPTIGRMDYFPAALESVRSQTYPHLEILIGDNASTDGTAAYIEQMKALDPRIRSYCESERSMPVNWQHGLDLARGEYLTIVSDDDLILPDFVERCLALLRADATLQVAACLCDLIDGASQILPDLTAPHQASIKRFGAGRQVLHWRTHEIGSLIMCCVMNTAWVRALGFSREAGVACDADLFWRAGIEGYATYFLHEVLVHYRIHTGAISNSPLRQISDSLAAMERMAISYPEVQGWKGWRRSCRWLAEGCVTWLIRAGRSRDAVRTLRQHRRRLSLAGGMKLTVKLLLHTIGLHPARTTPLSVHPHLG
jgi:glycosyltransferase involved in cell wall biosynthesis